MGSLNEDYHGRRVVIANFGKMRSYIIGHPVDTMITIEYLKSNKTSYNMTVCDIIYACNKPNMNIYPLSTCYDKGWISP